MTDVFSKKKRSEIMSNVGGKEYQTRNWVFKSS